MTLALWALVGAVIVLAGVIGLLALIHGEVILQPRDDDQIRKDIGPVASGLNVTPIVRGDIDDELDGWLDQAPA